jgi:transmembrane sensor
MSKLATRIEEASRHATPEWTPARERNVRARVDRRLEQARHVRRLAIACAVIALGAAGFFRARHVSVVAKEVPAVAKETESAARAPLLQLDDGSVVTSVSPTAKVEPVEVGPSAVSVKLTEGMARFSVTPNARRAFRVMATDVNVTVLGTVFTVALEPAGVRVAVERGSVRVAWPSGQRDLAVGETFVVDESARRAAPEPTSPTPSADAAPAVNVPHVNRSGHPEATSSWRTLAEDGDYAGAGALLAVEGPSAVRDEPGDLLLAADVARLGGHPEKAVTPLARVVSAHASDSRAPLAAFTLGRTLLDQLGRPREAADAFATARRLDPRGALAQDALAREVESWSRAGDASLSHARAAEYLRAYPKGRRVEQVKRLGGI